MGYVVLRRAVVDWLPSLVLAGAGGHELLYNHAPLWQWVGGLLVVAALPLRRRAPVPVLALTLGVAAGGWAAGVLLVVHLGVLVALHAVAWRCSRRTTVVATALVEAAAVVVAFRFGPTGSVNDAVVLLAGLTLSALFLGTTQRAQEQYLVALEDRAEQLRRDRHQREEIAAAAERTRIAREVHDIVAHSVSVMVAMSEGAARTVDVDTSRATMRQVAATGREALAELRRVLAVLHDADQRAPQPTLAALPGLVDDVDRAGLRVVLDVAGETGGLSEGLQATAYRIVQESLTNTLKHAERPQQARVSVAVAERDVTVVVTDDGQQHGPRGDDPQAGNGIRGMAERARMFGGSLAAGVRDDEQGWMVRCVLPREEAP